MPHLNAGSHLAQHHALEGCFAMLKDGDKRCGCGGGHATFGECVRAKSLKIEGCRDAVGGSDRTRQKKWDSELQAYRDARAQGIQPAGTSTRQIEAAVRVSNDTGKAYDAGAGG